MPYAAGGAVAFRPWLPGSLQNGTFELPLIVDTTAVLPPAARKSTKR